VADDLASECNETARLLRKPDGTIQYRVVNSEDPPGINGQSVYNGTSGIDRVAGGNDNDTILGNENNDTLDGMGGTDVVLGGDGNDRITDSSGDDVLKGGPGNDYLNGGIGLDLLLGGDGQDLLIGDHAAPFFDDPAQTKPGNEVMVGQVGENDYDSEGGEDVMTSNAAVDRFVGSAGFDWATHQYGTVAADDDMNINQNLLGLPLPVVVTRDRWQEMEAVSGSAFNDDIRGDNVVPSAVGGAGFSGCDVLDGDRYLKIRISV
jgi:Ca2+-binding RTX toxin-like protein